MAEDPLSLWVYREAVRVATEFNLDGETAVPKLYAFINSLIAERKAARGNTDPPASPEG